MFVIIPTITTLSDSFFPVHCYPNIFIRISAHCLAYYSCSVKYVLVIYFKHLFFSIEYYTGFVWPQVVRCEGQG